MSKGDLKAHPYSGTLSPLPDRATPFEIMEFNYIKTTTTTDGNWFSSSTMWVTQVEFR